MQAKRVTAVIDPIGYGDGDGGLKRGRCGTLAGVGVDATKTARNTMVAYMADGEHGGLSGAEVHGNKYNYWLTEYKSPVLEHTIVKHLNAEKL
ncbi:MAG: hypothetical protein JJU21_17615 [Salinarimonas sp.]|nr:hypothetical protein [Salinarimonas sp.]